jgi:diguanylate cyclase (GGDEF)-like protein
MCDINKRYKWRLILWCMAGLVALSAAVQPLIFVSKQKDTEAQLVSSAMIVATSAAQALSMDIEGYREFLSTRDVTSAYYGRMRDLMATIKASNDTIKHVYTEKRLDEKTTEFMLDAEPLDGPLYTPPGYIEPNNPQKEDVFALNVPGHYIQEHPKWGRLIVGCAPIVGEGGENLGLMGVDMDGRNLHRHFRKTFTMTVALNLIFVCLVLAALLMFSNPLIDRLLKDRLTGAFTKGHFDDLLSGEIKSSVRRRKGMALMMIDLDHFKRVNDTYGHAFGDKVLASVSEVIRASIRPSDYFVRYGGEEFAVIMPNIDCRRVEDVAERLRRAVETSPVFNAEMNADVAITVSIGVADLDRIDMSAAELLANADRALYEAKIKRNAVTGGWSKAAKGIGFCLLAAASAKFQAQSPPCNPFGVARAALAVGADCPVTTRLGAL